MLAVRVSREFHVQGASNLDEQTDSVFEELLSLECDKLSDADLEAELETARVILSVISHAPSFDEAVSYADAAIRTAIHASGGHTPGWQNTTFEPTRTSAEVVPAG